MRSHFPPSRTVVHSFLPVSSMARQRKTTDKKTDDVSSYTRTGSWFGSERVGVSNRAGLSVCQSFSHRLALLLLMQKGMELCSRFTVHTQVTGSREWLPHCKTTRIWMFIIRKELQAEFALHRKCRGRN